MILENSYYSIPILCLGTLFVYVYLRRTKLFYKWVKDHWFYKRSFKSKLSSYFYLAGIILLLFSLLDLRGAEKRIKGSTQNQKTLILIDTSASMLAEDVRPNRFEKALLLVKHYVKKAVGQEISIVVFSDSQKRIVPFTNDIDLLNARIDRLKTISLARGGTNLSLAISESTRYFRDSSNDSTTGNILIFTDAEETELGFKLEVPKDISVGLVGIGTAKGGTIPVRDRRGELRGNKKFKGEVIISKLDEGAIKNLGAEIPFFRHWIATSYSLPTEKIISFFNRSDQIKKSENEYRIRPVLSNWLIVPAVIFLILCYLLKFANSFSLVIAIFFFTGPFAFSQNVQGEKEKGPQKSDMTIELEDRLKLDLLDEKGMSALARSYLKDGFSEKAEVIFREQLGEKDITRLNFMSQMNFALAMVQVRKMQEAFNLYFRLQNTLPNMDIEKKEALAAIMRKNILKAIEQQKEDKKKQKDKNKEEQKKENKDNKKQKDNKQEDQEKENQGNKEKKEKQQNKDQKSEKEEDQQGQQQEDKEKEASEDQSEKEEREKNESLKNKNDQKKGKQKVPAIVKQLINDDNQLQKKFIDAKTTQDKNRERKDW